jgi:hypothetical protein
VLERPETLVARTAAKAHKVRIRVPQDGIEVMVHSGAPLPPPAARRGEGPVG